MSDKIVKRWELKAELIRLVYIGMVITFTKKCSIQSAKKTIKTILVYLF